MSPDAPAGQRYPPNDHRVVKPWRLCRLVPNLAAPSRTVPDQAGCQDPLTPAEQGRSGVGGSSRTDPYEAHPAERSMLPCALGALALPMRRSILGVMQFLLVRSGTGRDRPDSVPYRPCPQRALASGHERLRAVNHGSWISALDSPFGAEQDRSSPSTVPSTLVTRATSGPHLTGRLRTTPANNGLASSLVNVLIQPAAQEATTAQRSLSRRKPWSCRAASRRLVHVAVWRPEAGLTPVRKMAPGYPADGRRTRATCRPSESAEVAVTAARAATGAPRIAPTATSSSRPSRPPERPLGCRQ